MVAVVDCRVKDCGLSIRRSDVARPQVAMQHSRLDLCNRPNTVMPLQICPAQQKGLAELGCW